MVQFGLYLRSFQYSPWSEHYLAYENLKNALYEIRERFAPSSPPSPRSAAAAAPPPVPAIDPHELHERLVSELDLNLAKINQHYETTKDVITKKLNAIRMDSLNGVDLKDFKQDLEVCYSQAVILKDFASLNYTGFAKLLKKHDKLLKGHVNGLRASYIRDKVNKEPVFGVLDDIYRLQVETQYLYADFYHDGHRIDAEIALGASLMEKIGEAKKSRLARRAVLFSNVDLSAAEQGAIANTQDVADKKAADLSMTWMRARVAMMSVGQNDLYFSILTSLFLIFVGGCGQTFLLEYMVHTDPDCGQTITFFQFAFIAAAGAMNFVQFDMSNSSILKKVSFAPRKVAFHYHLILVVLSWLAAFTSAKAYYFKISVSLHMVFKSGILLINMVLGILFVKKRYSALQVFSVVLVTAGVLVTTLASLPANDPKKAEKQVDLVMWFTGLAVLSLSLVMTGFLGVFQDYTYEQFGKHNWEEVLFYVHLLGLPLYIVSADKIWADLVSWTFHNQTMWLALLGNSFLSFVGVRGIYNLTGLTTSLTTSLTITVRKFSSLIISAVFFSDAAFDLLQWGGASLVLLGSVMYSSVPGVKPKEEDSPKKPKKKKLRESSTVLRKSIDHVDEKQIDDQEKDKKIKKKQKDKDQ
eukprot:TRINITY_DN28637_c0_g1_i1.p1 TRINITY_DN28637_c0_g1~~TRINITY_DN28637_c0_g1_i1.p1  ORF type:complete len:639 (-),score=171.00 TRINITY_DN28637_c0_g1_i1:30-1946(-)